MQSTMVIINVTEVDINKMADLYEGACLPEHVQGYIRANADPMLPYLTGVQNVIDEAIATCAASALDFAESLDVVPVESQGDVLEAVQVELEARALARLTASLTNDILFGSGDLSLLAEIFG